MNRATGPPILESNHRRLGWTRGLAVRLADGLPWRLPRIDLTLFVTAPGLQEHMLEAMRLARDAQESSAGSLLEADTIVRYHGGMTNLGVCLLRTNYELADLDWAKLLKFDDLRTLFLFGYDTAYAITEARILWQPFLSSFGSEAQAGLARN